jgi:predicted molibdopterin-dependent oxidoreductase YjgC
VSVEFSFDDRSMTAHPGQSVGAALLANGVRSWRTTRFGGRPRGLFCGIGVCFDCLVTVNGEPNVRACLAAVADGDVVSTQVGDGHVASATERGADLTSDGRGDERD